MQRSRSAGRSARVRQGVAAALLVGVLATATACSRSADGGGPDRRAGSPTVTTGTGPADGVRTTTSELVFSGIRGTQTIAPQHVVLVNQASRPRTVSTAALSGSAPDDFAVSGLTAPVLLQPRQSLDLTVRFVPPADRTGSLSAQLVISTDSGPLTLGLYGLATRGLEGVREPALADVVTTLGFPVQVGSTELILGTGPALLGSEVPAPLFVAVGPTVTLTAVARYSPDEDLPYGWYLPGEVPVLEPTATILKGQFQTLNPLVQGTTSLAPGSAPFGIYIHSNSFGRDTFTQEALNTGPTRHAVRVYPLLRRSGAPVPHAYLLAFEDAANGDYQDYVFTLEGVRALAPG